MDAPADTTNAVESCALCGAASTQDMTAMCTPGSDLPLCLGHWNNWLDAAMFGPGTPSGVAAHLIREELNRGTDVRADPTDCLTCGHTWDHCDSQSFRGHDGCCMTCDEIGSSKNHRARTITTEEPTT